VANAIGKDSRIGPKFLEVIGWLRRVPASRRTSQPDLPLRGFGLPEGGGLLVRASVGINDWQKKRFASRIVRSCSTRWPTKKIAVLGFAFKKDTNDTRGNPPRSNVVRDLLGEHAKVTVYDPKVPAHEIIADTLGKGV